MTECVQWFKRKSFYCQYFKKVFVAQLFPDCLLSSLQTENNSSTVYWPTRKFWLPKILTATAELRYHPGIHYSGLLHAIILRMPVIILRNYRPPNRKVLSLCNLIESSIHLFRKTKLSEDLYPLKAKEWYCRKQK